MRFTKEQNEEAKRMSTIDVMGQTDGFEFKRTGYEWKCKQHDSLVVYSDGRGWKWYSRNVWGTSAVEWLTKVKGYSYREAMDYLLGTDNSKRSFTKTENFKIEKPKELQLPCSNTNNNCRRVFAYLSQTRGISPTILNYSLHNKLIYEDERHNCVFVGYDEFGKPRYASKRGTVTFGDRPAYKRDCTGSDKSYSFVMEGSIKEHLFIFEAPIDALSHATLNLEKARGMGIKDYETCWLKHTRLTLGGVSDRSLTRYLSLHPEVRNLSFCLDSDEPGIKASAEYKEKYEQKGYKVNVYQIPKGYGTDYNEYLCKFNEVKRNKTNQQNVHCSTAITYNNQRSR